MVAMMLKATTAARVVTIVATSATVTKTAVDGVAPTATLLVLMRPCSGYRWDGCTSTSVTARVDPRSCAVPRSIPGKSTERCPRRRRPRQEQQYPPLQEPQQEKAGDNQLSLMAGVAEAAELAPKSERREERLGRDMEGSGHRQKPTRRRRRKGRRLKKSESVKISALSRTYYQSAWYI